MSKIILVIAFCYIASSGFTQDCFWAQSAGGSVSETATDVAVDAAGNVYATGSFESASITFGSVTLTASSGNNFYLVKYDAAGNVLWANTANGIAEGYTVTTDALNNVIVAGYYDGASTSFSGNTLINSGNGDSFIVKYDGTGNLIWATSIGGISNAEYVYSIATDASNSIYVTGRFASSSVTIGSTVLTNAGTSGPDLFVAKLAPSGTVLWADGTGGSFSDIANGLVCDDDANIYVIGNFNSNSIGFGSTTLNSPGTGQSNMFIAKYDSTGSVIWANTVEGYLGDALANDIASDGINVYVQGEYSAESVTFGTDVLTNAAPGSTDIYTVKYNAAGNPVWAKTCGGNNNDYSKGITIDTASNVYTIGFFSSSSLDLNSDTTLNNLSTGSSYTTYISKYKSTGIFDWAQTIGSVNTIGYAIAAGQGIDIYFTGKFLLSSAIGTNNLSAVGSYDVFVADIYEFNSGVDAILDASCFGSSDGEATSFASAGHMPYTYLWSSIPSQTTVNASGLQAGNYTLTVTDDYGCEQIENFTINETASDNALICMVTVDTTSQYNIIAWDKTSFTTVDSFIVYREISTANYQPIAVIPFDSLSQFVDTVAALYFPNTGNPNVGTYRYKIQAVSDCGTSGPMSPYHNTLFISNSGGTFTWTQLYEIEGGANPVISYILKRDNLSDGNWITVGSVAGTQSFIVDPDFTTYSLTGSWKVETQWNITCTPAKSINSSSSNILSNQFGSGFDDNSMNQLVSIYPNPFNTFTTLRFANNASENSAVIIYDLLGNQVYFNNSIQGNTLQIYRNELAAGTYIISVFNENGNIICNQKLVIQ